MTSISNLHNGNKENFIIWLLSDERGKVPLYLPTPLGSPQEKNKQANKVERNEDEGYFLSLRTMSVSKGSHIQ